MILYKIGIDIIQEKEDFSDLLIGKFGNTFPSSREFSEFARSTIIDADPIANPDETLIQWYDRETSMFKCMERLIIQERLKEGFVFDDVVDVETIRGGGLCGLHRSGALLPPGGS